MSTPSVPTSTPAKWPWWYGLVGLVIGQIAAVAVSAPIWLTTPRPHYSATIVLDGMLVLTAVLLGRRRGALGRAGLGLRPMFITPFRAVLWIIAAVSGIGVVLSIYDSAALQHVHATHSLYLRPSTGVGTATMLIAGVLTAPIAEEIFFRGFLYRALRNRLRILSAVVISATVFGLVHWFPGGQPLWSVPPRIFMGIALCLLFEYSGSLYPGIALHMLLNSSFVALVEPRLWWLPLAAALLAAIFGTLRSLRDPRRQRHDTPRSAQPGERARSGSPSPAT